MVWFRVDDNLAAHPKARAAGLEAIGLWAVSGAYCGLYLLEGFVDESFVLTWPNGRKLAERLVAAGLWITVDGGWQFHEWDERQPSKASVVERREKTRKRQQEWRDRHRDDAPYNSVTNDVTNSVRDASLTQSSRARVPDPTRPDPSTKELQSPTAEVLSVAAPKRGTRLPTNWAPTEGLRNWAVSKGYSAALIDIETDKFVDYWHATPGAKGTKLDWDATWRNWLRNALPTRASPNGRRGTDANVTAHLALAEQLSERDRKELA